MKIDMKTIMNEAHKMAKEIKKEFPNIDYKFQFGINVRFLINEYIRKEKEEEEKKIKVKISRKGYSLKPNGKEIGSMTVDFKKDKCKTLNYKQLAKKIEEGHATILAEFKEEKSDIYEESITQLDCLALDIDSKENKITLFEMVALLDKKLGIYPKITYPTFSDTNFEKFRLIYRFEMPIDVETYKLLYKALVWKFGKYLDGATSNANRIWQGTNKKVNYIKHDEPIPIKLIIKLIMAYEKKIKREQEQTKIKIKEAYTEFIDEDYIKPEYKKECCDLIINSVNLKDFIVDNFGGSFKLVNGNWVGACVLHGGDNKGALVISESKKIYTCFTRCGTGNIYTIAKKVYNIENFSKLTFLIAERYGIRIPDEWVRKIK